MSILEKRISELLVEIYGSQAEEISSTLLARLNEFKANQSPGQQAVQRSRFSERDSILITYADQLFENNKQPLQVLKYFLKEFIGASINSVHLLPFYPYSSDDGFSIIDYEVVDPASGEWGDIHKLGENYRLMFDAVINHISQHSDWFQAYLKGDKRFSDYFIEMDPETDLSSVVRPRALPLLTPFETSKGRKHIWTTFSDDQIDLNYQSPELALEMIEILLFYVSHGAEIIRLDAIAYLWKEVGTSCIHLPQTHAMVKLWRAILDLVAPQVLLITETNVPHEENISYFGNGSDEAQLVYQFPLAPLVLDAFLTKNVGVLSSWAERLEIPSEETTFFNFIASHDGIGVRPAEGLLSPAAIEALVAQTQKHGGQVSHKHNSDGSQSVYELNITLYDFLNDPSMRIPETDLARFIASQAVMLSLIGVPGIYFHSLVGSRNCQSCMNETGRSRSINREKYDFQFMWTALKDPNSRPAQVLQRYRELLLVRQNQPAFHPNGAQQVLRLADSVFSLLRISLDKANQVLCLIDVSGEDVIVPLPSSFANAWKDMLTGETFQLTKDRLTIPLGPFQVRWLSPVN